MFFIQNGWFMMENSIKIILKLIKFMGTPLCQETSKMIFSGDPIVLYMHRTLQVTFDGTSGSIENEPHSL